MTLQELLGEELFSQVQAKLDEVNAKEMDKLKHVRYADLSEGNYVSKLKYDDIAGQLEGKEAELATANGLIAELKKGTKGNEELQGKITTYESDIANLQAELKETKIKSATKVGLLSAKCKDIDYVTYKLMEGLKEKGESLELDDNDQIKGWEDKLKGLQTQLPTHFETAGADGYEPFNKGGLPSGKPGEAEPESLADALRMQYENN